MAPMMLIIKKPEDMDTKAFMEYLRDVQERIEDLFKREGDIDGQIIGNDYSRLGYGYIDLLAFNMNAFMKFLWNRPCRYTILKPRKGVPMPTVFVQDLVSDGHIQRLK